VTSSDRVTPAAALFLVPPPPPLSAAEGTHLIRLAFSALREHFGLADREDSHPPEGLLSQPAGAFVSIYHDGSLRGCLGALRPREPLWQSVKEVALQAATCDPRFEPLGEEELSSLSIEISILGPLEKVIERSPAFVASAIRVGQHGLSLRHRGQSGLLLPQVAEKQGWDAIRFLEETCRKAGLPPGAWSEDGADLSAFRCVCFHGASPLPAPPPPGGQESASAGGGVPSGGPESPR
jgi:AmmeMemoRadiSam system protein A